MSKQKPCMNQCMSIYLIFINIHLLQLKVSLSRICMNPDNVQLEHDDINILKIEVHVCFLVRLRPLDTLFRQHNIRVNSLCTSGWMSLSPNYHLDRLWNMDTGSSSKVSICFTFNVSDFLKGLVVTFQGKQLIIVIIEEHNLSSTSICYSHESGIVETILLVRLY